MTRTRLIYFSDLLALIRQMKRSLLGVGIGCFLLTFLLILFTQPLKFRAHATFQQASERYEETSSLQSFLKSMRISDESSSISSLLQSRTLTERVCQKLGMQIKPLIPFEFLKRAKQNLLAETGRKSEIASEARFADVLYSGEEPEVIYLRPLANHRFDLLDKNKKLIASGEKGIPLETSKLKFTLKTLPKGEESFFAQPISDCISEARRQLKVKPNRLDSKLLEISFSDPNREVAELFVEELMQTLQGELEQQHAYLAEKQLLFLDKRKEELQLSYQNALKEHADYLSKTLGEEGLVGLTQEVELITAPKEEYTARLNALDLDLKRWQEINRTRQLLVHAMEEQKHPSIIPCEERLDPTAMIDPQFVGIDLATAQKFYAEYSCQKEALIADLKELSYVRKQLMLPTFEMTALTKVMQDSVSQEMVQHAARLSLQLCEETNLSPKEQERLKDSLATQKRFILSHLNRISDLSKMKLRLVDRKMAGLQRTAIELIKGERTILQEKLQELQDKLRHLPQRWRLENELKLKREMTLLIMEGMAQLSESKLVDHHLFSVSSHPLDHAFVPLRPTPQRLTLLSSMGSVIGLVGYFLFQLLRKSPHAIPFTAQSLQALGATVLRKEDLIPSILHRMPQVIACFSSLKDLARDLGDAGYSVKEINSDIVRLSHKSMSAQIAAWRDDYDFIVLEAPFIEMGSYCKIADSVIAPIGSPEKIWSLLDMALEKTIFLEE